MVPKCSRETVLRHAHRLTHNGVQRTYEDLWERFFWKGMFMDTQTSVGLVKYASGIRGRARERNT